MKPGSRALVQLCDMRRELIGRLDRAVTGGDLALLASVQLAIVAIDAIGDHSGEADGPTMAQDSVLPRSKLKVQMPPGAATPRSGVHDQVGPTLMPISDRAYREIWENLSKPGYEHVTVGENGEIHLGRVRLIRLQCPGAASP
jgi:hypothetical protein